MTDVLDVIWMGLKDSALMAWEVWWALVLGFAIPEKKPAPEPVEDPEPFDAFADGFPVPPLPGQKLPPSPRAARRAAAATAAATTVIEAAPAADTSTTTEGDPGE